MSSAKLVRGLEVEFNFFWSFLVFFFPLFKLPYLAGGRRNRASARDRPFVPLAEECRRLWTANVKDEPQRKLARLVRSMRRDRSGVGSGSLLGILAGLFAGWKDAQLRHQAQCIHNNSCRLYLFTDELVDNHAPDCHPPACGRNA